MRSILELVFGTLDGWLANLPMWSAKPAVAALLLAPILAVLFRTKREQLLRDAPDSAAWRDLRIWAALVTLPYLVLYLFLA